MRDPTMRRNTEHKDALRHSPFSLRLPFADQVTFLNEFRSRTPLVTVGVVYRLDSKFSKLQFYSNRLGRPVVF